MRGLLLKGSSNGDGAGLCGTRREARNFFAVEEVLRRERRFVWVVEAATKAEGEQGLTILSSPHKFKEVRTELDVYWSHCGSFRVAYADQLRNPDTGEHPVAPLQNLADMAALGEEVAASGWKALKTNIFL